MADRVELPNPAVQRTWAEQMALEKIDKDRFRSQRGAPFGPFITRNGEQRPRAYGGHVYAQAAYAASRTVESGFLIHSVTGYFTTIGLADEPFIYEVQTVRNGKNYCVRKVDVWQIEKSNICFSSICSFKRPEVHFLNIQRPRNLYREYSSLFGGKSISDLEIKSGFGNLRAAYTSGGVSLTTAFPGMITSILPIEAHHQKTNPIKRQNLYVYSSIEDGSFTKNPNLDACAHLYHSDRESVWGIVRQYELLDTLDSAASLSHTVVFHSSPDQIRFNKGGTRNWFYLETGSERVSDGRGLHQGRIYDEDGNHIATTMQDGGIRLSKLSEEDIKERERKLNLPGKL